MQKCDNFCAHAPTLVPYATTSVHKLMCTNTLVAVSTKHVYTSTTTSTTTARVRRQHAFSAQAGSVGGRGYKCTKLTTKTSNMNDIQQ
ncbi:unnamed protein product, partial [Ceratitis capitata]